MGNVVLGVDDFSTGSMQNLERFTMMGGAVENVDVRSEAHLYQCFAEIKPESVIHLAANASITLSEERPVNDLFINAIETLNVINLCKKFNVKHFIFSSTSAVYAETKSTLHESSDILPASPYGVSKMAAEMYIRSRMEHYVIFRFANIYGPRQQPIGQNQLISRAIRHFKYGDEFHVNGDGKQKRDYLFVGDVIRAINNVLSDGVKGTFNLGSGVSSSVNDVLGILEQLYDVKGYPWKHTSINDPRKNVQMNISSVKSKLGWKPATSLVEGIRCTKQWWDER
jgi:UDP-glucose 4-epimerase